MGWFMWELEELKGHSFPFYSVMTSLVALLLSGSWHYHKLFICYDLAISTHVPRNRMGLSKTVSFCWSIHKYPFAYVCTSFRCLLAEGTLVSSHQAVQSFPFLEQSRTFGSELFLYCLSHWCKNSGKNEWHLWESQQFLSLPMQSSLFLT